MESTPEIGDIYRDTYGDNSRRNVAKVKNTRHVRVVAVHRESVTMRNFHPEHGTEFGRRNIVSLKTLQAGYEFIRKGGNRGNAT